METVSEVVRADQKTNDETNIFIKLFIQINYHFVLGLPLPRPGTFGLFFPVEGSISRHTGHINLVKSGLPRIVLSDIIWMTAEHLGTMHVYVTYT